MKHSFKLNNVSVAFNPDRQLFTNLSFELPGPGFYFLTGRNGAGKSTLFKVIEGRLNARYIESGSAMYNGITYDLATPGYQRFAREQCSAVPQQFDYMLAPQFSFYENLQFCQMGSHPAYRLLPLVPAIPPLLARFQIPFDQAVEKLSGGQRQILAIMMSLHKATTLLLLDEPTATLDSQNAQLVMQFLQELQQQKGLIIVIISHDQALLSYATQPPINLSR